MLFTLLITSLYLIAVISPGPDFFIVSKNALTYSRKVAVVTAVGVSIGVAVHTLYSVFALNYITQHSHYFINFVKYLGAAYLIYLGSKGLFSKSDPTNINTEQETLSFPLSTAFMSGLLCNLLNPKAILFFISIFTFIMESHVSLAARAAYGMEMTVLTLFWFVGLACFITIPSIIQKLHRIQTVLIKILSALLLMMGIYLLFH